MFKTINSVPLNTGELKNDLLIQFFFLRIFARILPIKAGKKPTIAMRPAPTQWIGLSKLTTLWFKGLVAAREKSHSPKLLRQFLLHAILCLKTRILFPAAHSWSFLKHCHQVSSPQKQAGFLVHLSLCSVFCYQPLALPAWHRSRLVLRWKILRHTLCLCDHIFQSIKYPFLRKSLIPDDHR